MATREADPTCGKNNYLGRIKADIYGYCSSILRVEHILKIGSFDINRNMKSVLSTYQKHCTLTGNNRHTLFSASCLTVKNSVKRSLIALN